MSLQNSSRVSFTILRFATAFGVSERIRFDLTVNEFVWEILKKNVLNIYDKDTYRPYCHVKDFARAILLVIKAKKIKTNYEIFNVGKILFYDISETVIDIFLAYTQMIKLYYNDSLIETPMVVFNGSDKNTAKYISVFSIKKSNNESRYGPFYYFTDLHNSMKYACYDRETQNKYNKGGLVRFIIYPGKIKMFLKKDKPDRSQMAKYIFEKYPIEKYTSQFRDNDCIWTENYNSAYNGSYIINMDEKNDNDNDNDNNNDNDNDNDKYYLAPRICISDYTFQAPLSFYYINTEDIPNKYEYDFKNYKII